MDSHTNIEESEAQFGFLVSDLLELLFEKAIEAAHGHVPWPKVIDGRYTCTLSSTDEFYNYMVKASTLVTSRNPMFLDVGCGVGHKMLLAHSMGHNAYGLEIVNSYITEGRKLLQLFGVHRDRFIEGDALEYNDYSQFDVLFCDCPFFDKGLQQQLQERIVSQVRPGTVIILFSGSDGPLYIKK